MNSNSVTQINTQISQVGFKAPLSAPVLRRENRIFQGTGGISQENHQVGFCPAFYDSATNRIYPSRYADGKLAPCHLLDGLPEAVIVKREPNGRVSAVKATVVAGFTRNDMFYSREQAAQLVANRAE